MADRDEMMALFPVVIQVSDLEQAPALNAGVLGALDEIRRSIPNSKPDGWSCDLYTTINQGVLKDRPEMRELMQVFLSKVTQFAEALKYDVARFPPWITDCWLNVYQRGHAQEIHRHPNQVFSGIYYVEAPPGSARTLFHSEMSDTMVEPPVAEPTALNQFIYPLEPRTGRLVVFRSWLRHSVQPSAIDQRRVTIAFNARM